MFYDFWCDFVRPTLEEWLHRWANVTSLELHFVVPEAVRISGGV